MYPLVEYPNTPTCEGWERMGMGGGGGALPLQLGGGVCRGVELDPPPFKPGPLPPPLDTQSPFVAIFVCAGIAFFGAILSHCVR